MDSNAPQEETDVEGHRRNFRVDGPDVATDDVAGHMPHRKVDADADDVDGHMPRRMLLEDDDADDVEGHKKNFR